MAAPKSSSRPRRRKPAASSPEAPRVGTNASAELEALGAATGGAVANGLASLVEQLTNRIIRPLDLVMLSRERIQDTLDEAAERGRLTRTDANELVAELVRCGRQQTDDLLADVERLLERGREQLGSATRRSRLTEPVERLVRGAGRVRRTAGAGPSLPIAGYEELTARQVEERLKGLTPAELRQLHEHERRHANRKSVLAAIAKELR
jgi:polyhydroxyalkanoate synthesis regulator phasin